MVMSSFFSPLIPSSPQGLCVPLHHQYVGEISPRKLRGFANSTSSFFWSLGKAIGQISGQRYKAIDYSHNSFLDPFHLLLLPVLFHPFLSLLEADTMNSNTLFSLPGSCWAASRCGPCWWPPVESQHWSSWSRFPSSQSPLHISSCRKKTRKASKKVTEGLRFLFLTWLRIILWCLLSPYGKK